FVARALMRLGAALMPFKGGGYAAPLHLVPDVLKERLQVEGLLDDSPSPKPLRIAFEARPRAGFLSIHRAHPLTGVLAETFLENALDDGGRQDDPATLPRCGVWDTDAVEAVTTVLLLRIRHRLHSRGRLGPVFSMAEEAAAIAFAGAAPTRIAAGDEGLVLLDAAGGSVIDRVRDARLKDAVAGLPRLLPALDAYAGERAAALAEDHTRVRQALGSRAAVTVEAVTPVDVIGLYVLLPRL
ncbi:MAG: helicase, partial [Geminicoccaceae bacterium]